MKLFTSLLVVVGISATLTVGRWLMDQAQAPNLTQSGPVLFSENFDYPLIGQLRRDSGGDRSYQVAYEDGEYVIRHVDPSLYVGSIVETPGYYGDSILGVDARLVGDTAA